MPASVPATRVATRRTPHPRQTLSRLETEWRSLATRWSSLEVARSWSFLGAEVLDSLCSLDQVLAATGFRPAPSPDRRTPQPRSAASTAAARSAGERAAGGDRRAAVDVGDVGDVGERGDAVDRADAILRALVRQARTDELAARVVLQRLLPGLSAIARRQGRCMSDHLQAFDDVLAAAWGVIRNFPVERRRLHIAAALLRDCEYYAFRRERRRMLVHDATPTNLLDRAVEADEIVIEPLVEVLELIGQAQGHLVDGDLALLGALLSGKQLRAAAADLAVSERTVRNHRDAVVHRLRAALAA